MLHIAPGSPCSLAHPRTAGLHCLVQDTKLSRYAPRRPHSTLPAQQQDQAVQCSRWISFFTILPSTRAHAAEKYYEISSQHAFSSVRKCARTLAHAQERPLFPSNHTISPLFLSLLPRHRPLTTPQTLPPTNPHRPLQAEEKKFSPHPTAKRRPGPDRKSRMRRRILRKCVLAPPLTAPSDSKKHQGPQLPAQAADFAPSSPPLSSPYYSLDVPHPIQTAPPASPATPTRRQTGRLTPVILMASPPVRIPHRTSHAAHPAEAIRSRLCDRETSSQASPVGETEEGTLSHSQSNKDSSSL